MPEFAGGLSASRDGGWGLAKGLGAQSRGLRGLLAHSQGLLSHAATEPGGASDAMQTPATRWSPCARHSRDPHGHMPEPTGEWG